MSYEGEWTTKAPTIPGYYWLQTPDWWKYNSKNISIVRVIKLSLGQLAVLWHGDDDFKMINRLGDSKKHNPFNKAFWCGPLEEHPPRPLGGKYE